MNENTKGAFATGFIVGAVLLCAGHVLVVWSSFTETSTWQSSAIERGYATYCPDNGEFAWKGECK